MKQLQERAQNIASEAQRSQLKSDCLCEVRRCLLADEDQYEDLKALFMLRDEKGNALLHISDVDSHLLEWGRLTAKIKSMLVLAQVGWYSFEVNKICALYKSKVLPENQAWVNQLLSIWRMKILMQVYAEPLFVKAVGCFILYLVAPFWVFGVFSALMALASVTEFILSPYGEMLFFPSYPRMAEGSDDPSDQAQSGQKQPFFPMRMSPSCR